MDDHFKIPSYIMKQIIAVTLNERKNDLVKKAYTAKNQSQKGVSSDYHTIQNYVATAMNTEEMAKQIRFGNIPLNQCIAELTTEEKQTVYRECQKWYEENLKMHAQSQEEKEK